MKEQYSCQNVIVKGVNCTFALNLHIKMKVMFCIYQDFPVESTLMLLLCIHKITFLMTREEWYTES